MIFFVQFLRTTGLWVGPIHKSKQEKFAHQCHFGATGNKQSNNSVPFELSG